jgi:hypothetical protein
MILLPLVSASLDTLKPATLNKEYTILQSCSDATWINISISNSNGLILTDKAMTYNGTTWEYKFTPNTLGRHDIAYLTDGCEKSNTAYFYVDPKDNTGSILFFIFVYTLFYAITILGLIRKHEWICLGGCMGLLVLGVYTGINGFGNYKDDLTSVISYITIMIGLGLGFESLKEITNY